MTVTYFFMLWFVFWFCYRIGMFFSNIANMNKELTVHQTLACNILNLLWAVFGAFFFHSIW